MFSGEIDGDNSGIAFLDVSHSELQSRNYSHAGGSSIHLQDGIRALIYSLA